MWVFVGVCGCVWVPAVILRPFKGETVQKRIFKKGFREGKGVGADDTCMLFRYTTWITAMSFHSLKSSAVMTPVLEHWCGGLGDGECWIVLWTLDLRRWLHSIPCPQHSCCISDRCGDI